MDLHHRIGHLLLISLLIVFVVACPAAAQQYVITDLGKLGGTTSQAVGLSENGYVAGWSETNSNPSQKAIKKPFIWKRSIMTELPSLAAGRGAMSTAFAMPPNAGTFWPTFYMTGDAVTSTGAIRAYLYRNSFWPSMTNLGVLPNTTESHGLGVNSQGQVVGWVATPGNPAKAFFYTGGGMDDISSGSQSVAYGINDAGQAVGYFRYQHAFIPIDHAFLYNTANRQRQDLGTLAGHFNSYALAINQSGQVVGYVSTKPFQTGTYRGFIYSNGTVQIIGVIGGKNNIARAINNSGQVVGSFTAADGDRAYIYQNNQIVDLNTLIPQTSGWVVRAALSINNLGQIVGYGTIGGENHAFLMTPIPSTYNVVEIPLVPSPYWSGLLRMNNSGQVVGASDSGRAAVWDMTNGVMELNNVPAPSHAYDINDFGEIVGESAGRAFYRNPNSGGSITDLGTLGGLGSVALEISTWRTTNIVGFSPAGVDVRAFITMPNSVSMTPLPLPPGSFTQSAATAVNDFNQVVGEAQGMFADGTTFSTGFVWTTSDSTIALPLLGNLSSTAQAWDINNAGQIVGRMELSLGGQPYDHACIWKKDDSGQWRVTDLGSPGRSLTGRSRAFAINNLGQIVGLSNIKGDGTMLPQDHAFLWYNGAMIDLNDYIPPNSGILLTTASDINEFGQIVCFGRVIGQQQQRVYLLTR